MQWGAWSAQGGMYPVQINTGLAVDPQDLYISMQVNYFYLNGYYDSGYQAPGYEYLYDLSGAPQGNVTLYGGFVDFACIQDQSWGVWQNCLGGSYSGTLGERWSFDFEATAYVDGTVEAQQLASYDIMGPWNTSNNQMDGSVLGGWTNLDDLSPITGVSAGEIVGTFNPTDSTWQAALLGTWIETNEFLVLAATSPGQAKLEAMNIPAIEIGRANLSGSDLFMNGETIQMNGAAAGTYDGTGTFTGIAAGVTRKQ